MKGGMNWGKGWMNWEDRLRKFNHGDHGVFFHGEHGECLRVLREIPLCAPW